MSLPCPSANRSRVGFGGALAVLLALPVVKVILADSIDPDFFWHVRVADQLLTDGIGPVPDPFSFMSRPGEWTPFSWLGELAMKLVYDAAGLRGVVGVHALCSAAFFGFIACACLESTRRLCGAPRYLATLVSVAFAMLLSLAFLSFRPVTFALALMSAMGWLLWRDRNRNGDRGGRLVWLIVPMTVVLTNLHLYVILFVAGLWAMAVGARLDSWGVPSPRVRRLALLAVACTLAAAATPMLPGCVRNAIWFNGEDPMVRHALVAEIVPFHAGALGKFVSLGVIGLVALAARARRRIGYETLCTLAIAVVILFQMGRFATVFAILACPIAACVMPRLNDAALARRSVRVATLAVAALVVGRCAVGFPRASTTMDAWLTRTGDADNLRYPTAAAAFVDRAVPRRTGRLFNELTWGGYLIWRLGDRYQVFMDGRTLIYPASFWTDVYVVGGDAQRRVLAGQTADAAILPIKKSRLHASLVSLGWREVYADARARVLLPPDATAAVP